MNIGDQLEKLEKLRQSGSLSDDEFAQAKANLLNGGGTATAFADDPRQVEDDFAAYSYKPVSGDFQHAPAEVRQSEARLWGMILHLSLFAGYAVPFAGWAAPIVIWQLKKDDLPGMDQHGKNALNWLISHLIYFVACVVLCFVIIGAFLMPVLLVVSVVFPIIAAIKAHNGEVWKYPLTIEFF